MGIPKLAGMAAVAIVFIAACGGSPSAPTVGPNTTQPPVATSAVPTSDPVSPTNPPIGGTIDVCSLLTPAELSAALGETYVAGTLDSVGQCLWNIEGATGNTGSLVVGYINPAEYSFLHGLFGTQTGSTDLTVGGHAAFYNPEEGYTSLWVDLGGARTFVLSFPQANDLDPSYQAIAVQLAEIALSRM